MEADHSKTEHEPVWMHASKLLRAILPVNTMLELGILGLLGETSLSGYDVRRLFSTTVMTTYSDSPGSIYPALRRLSRRGLARSTRARGGRRRSTFSLTPPGRLVLRRWLDEAVTTSDVARRAGVLELKLAFLSTSRPGRLRSFLSEWAAATASQEREAARALKSLRSDLSLSAVIALEIGLRQLQARSRAVRAASAELQGRH